MAKYYVQCGPIRTILSAETPHCAAMAAIDRSLQAHLWIYDDDDLSEVDCRNHLMLEALMHLEPVLRISEQGFDRDDAVMIGTPETIDQWHRLMVGMSRLFVAAGLAPRTMSQVAGIGGSVTETPRLPR
ncbi:MAG: hypothetical protein AAGA03_02430 [Planctomycetota bacterium]